MIRNRLRVGDHILSVMELALLPVGTVIGPEGERYERYVKVDAMNYRRQDREGGRTMTASNFDINGYNTVVEYPPGYVVPEPGPESLAEYKWRFREHMLHARDRHGVSNAAVLTGLRLLGCDDEAMPLGAGLPIFANRDANRLPAGSLVYTGLPDDPDSFAIWQRDTTLGWRQVLGRDRMPQPDPNINSMVTVAVVNDHGVASYDPPNWMASVTDDTLEAFQARAWMVGMKQKASESWCGTVEEVLRTVGVTMHSAENYRVNGIGKGDEIRASQAPGLPVGSVLSHTTDNHKVFYLRVEDAPVRYGTRRVLAFRIDGSTDPVPGHSNFASTMTVELIPWPDSIGLGAAPGVDVGLWRPTAWEALPVGSVLCYDRGSWYVKARDGRLITCRVNHVSAGTPTPPVGQHTQRDFGLSERNPGRMLVVRFGE